MNVKPIIGISIGDYNGIGPEVILKALIQLNTDDITPVVLGSPEILSFYKNELLLLLELNEINHIDDVCPGKINLLNPDPGIHPVITPGTITSEAGLHAMKAIEKGIALCMNNKAHALVTAPISKEAVNLAGYSIPGHTEFLAEQTGTDEVLMILINKSLRIALVTTHIPVKDVAYGISENLIFRKAELLHDALIHDFGVKEPTIAVFGLNPHAGDGGFIGKEETEIIVPAIKKLNRLGIAAAGPFAADSFFGSGNHQNYDGILAMYHDQGLAPFKALSFGDGVNYTAGLPMVRTSPDHGTAFNIAGLGKANPDSFIQAFKLAVNLCRIRGQP